MGFFNKKNNNQYDDYEYYDDYDNQNFQNNYNENYNENYYNDYDDNQYSNNNQKKGFLNKFSKKNKQKNDNMTQGSYTNFPRDEYGNNNYNQGYNEQNNYTQGYNQQNNYTQGYNQQNNYTQGYDNYSKEELKEIKREEKEKNYLINRNRKKSKRKSVQDYSYNTGYENEEIYYDDQGRAIVKEKTINYKKILIITMSFFYFLFLIIGVTGTTFSQGYKPQIINSKIRGQRITYEKVQSNIAFLENLDDFKGLPELQELYKTGNFQSRIPPLKESLKEVSKKSEDLKSATYKSKESDYVNTEMIDMVRDLLETETATLTLTIKFYESMSGYNGSNEQLQKQQDQLIAQHQIYKNKLANYKVRLEQIKSYELKLED